ncbi:UDP-N-acetylmuramoyl-L-alanine--D-glutamate ligase [Flavobacterium sp. CS20]|uniref:UDP-N-acetylmuramoyl-L-alanine--D-glutamate ligase n=1 Tax=Flavobacterium sp. CS20 TaxID=2775246 RepID=UPI001B39F9D6|nr:UDP-N-acetylmuramoyl-L-alanine--D-glutamate ligase [Flavobacterium sp. CS20]QTY26912.1 UDP-N-acetylmuramoyl-L-alanine--D-glutamate ligase [Flavobacterium sp. CS20]
MQNIAILGSGKSGLGLAILASKKQYNVFLSDSQKISASNIETLKNLNIEFEEHQHSLNRLADADLIVKSPGIPDDAQIVKQLKEKQIPIISEIEFAFQHTKANIIGITGSNGKTTVAYMLYHLLEDELKEVDLAGNIGLSFAKSVAEKEAKHYVLEISSFQLDGIENFRPHIAIITSITPDHLDRYQNNFDSYTASKFRIAKNQQPDDFLIYNADENHLCNWLKNHPVNATCIPISTEKELKYGTYLKDNEIIINLNKKIHIMPITALQVEGKQNTKNAMVASTVAHLLKIRKETIREKLETFQGVEHRLEHVLKINNVNYINDSKATNINATFYALDSATSDVIWIVGGVDKGNVYEDLLPLVNEKVKAIICLGVDNQKIIKAFKSCVDEIYETQSMQECVKIAYHLAKADDTVLLSPACASFDLFDNYEDRGRQFKEAVQNL